MDMDKPHITVTRPDGTQFTLLVDAWGRVDIPAQELIGHYKIEFVNGMGWTSATDEFTVIERPNQAADAARNGDDGGEAKD